MYIILVLYNRIKIKKLQEFFLFNWFINLFKISLYYSQDKHFKRFNIFCLGIIDSSLEFCCVIQNKKIYTPQADVSATSSDCKLLDRDTFVLDSDVSGGEGEDDEFLSLSGDRGTREELAAWSFMSKSPWNRTRRDVGVGGSVWPTMRVVGDVADSSTTPVATTPVDVDVDADADAPDDGRGGGGSSGMLDAWEGAQFWMHLNGSRSLACINLWKKDL